MTGQSRFMNLINVAKHNLRTQQQRPRPQAWAVVGPYAASLMIDYALEMTECVKRIQHQSFQILQVVSEDDLQK